MQLKLNDVSFWYHDKTASSITPNEFTGLLALTLPSKGIDVDLKIRLIPSTIPAHSKDSRVSLEHFHVIEKVAVSISEDVDIQVRESNHSVLMTLFKPIVVMRLKDALEKTLSEELRGVVEWMDGVAWDVARRREVFEDTGLSRGGSLTAALWSELGRLQREGMDDGIVGWRATGTGVIVEGGKTTLAIGAEPQILGGEKRGPLGTGSESLEEQSGKAVAGMDVDVDVDKAAAGIREVLEDVEGQAKGLVKEGKKQAVGFRKSVERKRKEEIRTKGWQSASFDL